MSAAPKTRPTPPVEHVTTELRQNHVAVYLTVTVRDAEGRLFTFPASQFLYAMEPLADDESST